MSIPRADRISRQPHHAKIVQVTAEDEDLAPAPAEGADEPFHADAFVRLGRADLEVAIGALVLHVVDECLCRDEIGAKRSVQLRQGLLRAMLSTVASSSAA